MKNYSFEHQLLRRKAWIDAWTATAADSYCGSSSTATTWADAALKAFDERFNDLSEYAVRPDPNLGSDIVHADEIEKVSEQIKYEAEKREAANRFCSKGENSDGK